MGDLGQPTEVIDGLAETLRLMDLVRVTVRSRISPDAIEATSYDCPSAKCWKCARGVRIDADAARQHSQLDRLRASLLTLSVDMSSIDRDIRAYDARGWQRDYAQFFFEDAPFLIAEHDEHGSES